MLKFSKNNILVCPPTLSKKKKRKRQGFQGSNYIPNLAPHQIWDGGRKHKIAKSKNTMLVTPLFWLLIDEQDNFHKLWNFWEISPKKIEKNQRQSQIIAGEHLPSWSLSLVTKSFSFYLLQQTIFLTLLLTFWWLLMS